MGCRRSKHGLDLAFVVEQELVQRASLRVNAHLLTRGRVANLVEEQRP
ncbi:hypothetical protein [Hymenobacter sp. PAMC 26628]|nr:hypothetical protein [Hymenobacter sp. PAMC 26628]